MDIVTRKKEALVLLDAKKQEISSLVGNDKQLLEQYRAVMLELSLNKALYSCAPESIIGAATRIVQLGLNPNPLLSEAYVIARGLYEKRDGEKPVKVGEVAELQIGVKGYKILGFRSGWEFSGQAVYACDAYSCELGEMEPKISLIPNEEQREEENADWVFKNLKGVICFSRNPKGHISKKFIPRKKLEKIRLKSPTQYGAIRYLKGIWGEWSEEMYIKSALKYFIKREPVDSRVMAAIIEDEKSERESIVRDNVAPQINQSQTLKTALAIKKAVAQLEGLSLYAFENQAVVEGNTFNYASILKEIGFECNDGEWMIVFESEDELLEACLPADVEILKKEEYAIVPGIQTETLHELLKKAGFNWFQKKQVWAKKLIAEKAA